MSALKCWCRACDAEARRHLATLASAVIFQLVPFRLHRCPDCGDHDCARAVDHTKPCGWKDAA